MQSTANFKHVIANAGVPQPVPGTTLLPAVNHTAGKVCLVRRSYCCGCFLEAGDGLCRYSNSVDTAYTRKHGSAFWPRTWLTPLAAPGGVTTVSLARTDGGHIEGVGLSQSPFQNGNSRTFEVRPAGNAVNLEEEMMKVAANQMDFQTATALYKRSLNLIKTALGKR